MGWNGMRSVKARFEDERMGLESDQVSSKWLGWVKNLLPYLPSRQSCVW